MSARCTARASRVVWAPGRRCAGSTAESDDLHTNHGMPPVPVHTAVLMSTDRQAGHTHNADSCIYMYGNSCCNIRPGSVCAAALKGARDHP